MATYLPQNEFISGSAALLALTTAKPEAASLTHDAATLSDGEVAASHNSGEREPSAMLAYPPSEAATVSGREPVAATNLPCAGAEPATRQADHGRAAVGRTGGSIPPTGATTLTHNAVTQAVEIQSSCGGGESRPATDGEGVSYPEAQANARSLHGSYRTTGEQAPSGPRAGSRIETVGVAPDPHETKPNGGWFSDKAADRRARLATGMHEAANNIGDDLEQLIGVAGKRRRRPLALPRFAPDFPEIWKAMHDKTAPRTVLDPLWADEPPLFLKG